MWHKESQLLPLMIGVTNQLDEAAEIPDAVFSSCVYKRLGGRCSSAQILLTLPHPVFTLKEQIVI